MNYELAKELKDAGFAADRDVPGTQTGTGGGHTWLYGPKGVESDDMAYVPTLSELIAACGDRFSAVGRIFDADNGYKTRVVNGMSWVATGTDGACEGSTPEEAAAHLWLALNPK